MLLQKTPRNDVLGKQEEEEEPISQRGSVKDLMLSEHLKRLSLQFRWATFYGFLKGVELERWEGSRGKGGGAGGAGGGERERSVVRSRSNIFHPGC